MNFNLLKTGAVALALSVAFLLGGKADAATIYEGNYDATSARTGGNDHAVWLAGLFSGVGNHWQFAGGAGAFNVGAGNATAALSGLIQNNSNANLQLNLAVVYKLRDPNRPGRRGAKIRGVAPGLTVAEKTALTKTWSYYNVESATLTGVGALAGLKLTLTPFPLSPNEIPFQLGDSANDKNQGLGASGWFSWNIVSQANNSNYVAQPSGRPNTRGDININLTPVPLPAAGMMLLAGLGGFGALRMRKRKS